MNNYLWTIVNICLIVIIISLMIIYLPQIYKSMKEVQEQRQEAIEECFEYNIEHNCHNESTPSGNRSCCYV